MIPKFRAWHKELRLTRKRGRMKLSMFIELLQEEGMNPDWEVSCGILINPVEGTISFPASVESVEE